MSFNVGQGKERITIIEHSDDCVSIISQDHLLNEKELDGQFDVHQGFLNKWNGGRWEPGESEKRPDGSVNTSWHRVKAKVIT